MPIEEEENRKIQIGISFSPQLLRKIDELKRRENRSSYVNRMLEEYLQVKPWILAEAEKREKSRRK